ncbi:Uncharacterised protein [Vibrio cholerae]|nr:Uncharacterised protein [Vibrio cholerae]CSB85335.1 Uncharacterised protein [Vibrio cholerae]
MWPRWISGAVGSAPNLIRSGRFSLSLAMSSSSGISSSTPRLISAKAASILAILVHSHRFGKNMIVGHIT